MKVDAINAGLRFLEAKTCIRFQHSRVNTNKIRVTDGKGCHSMVGMQDGEQDLILGDGCEAIGIVAHEFAHALGFHHMHNRYDRDQYITVDPNNIKDSEKHTFDKLTINDSIIYTPYEYGGMMQYAADTLTKTPNIKNSSSFTMIPTDINYVHTMGNRMISFYSVEGLNGKYCAAKCPASTSANCQNGGLPNPNNCAICNCPLGYAGALCEQMPPASGGCGGKLTATTVWQAKSFKYGENTTIIRHQYTECHHWIKAPAGEQIQVRITNMTNPACDYGCQYNGIEFKLMANQRMTNPKICCVEFSNIIHTAELNPLPVIAHNRYGITEFTIEYKYDPETTTRPAATTTRPAATTTRSAATTTRTAATTTRPAATTTRPAATTTRPAATTTRSAATTTRPAATTTRSAATTTRSAATTTRSAATTTRPAATTTRPAATTTRSAATTTRTAATTTRTAATTTRAAATTTRTAATTTRTAATTTRPSRACPPGPHPKKSMLCGIL